VKYPYRRIPQTPGFDPGLIHVRFVVDKVAVGQFYLRVIRSSPVSTSAPTLRTLIRLGTCQKATFFQMMGNTGEKVLSLSSERVYYTNSHVRLVPAWCGTAVSFSLLSYSAQAMSSGRQLQSARCLHLLRPCPEHEHRRCYVGHLPLSIVRRLKPV